MPPSVEHTRSEHLQCFFIDIVLRKDEIAGQGDAQRTLSDDNKNKTRRAARGRFFHFFKFLSGFEGKNVIYLYSARKKMCGSKILEELNNELEKITVNFV